VDHDLAVTTAPTAPSEPLVLTDGVVTLREISEADVDQITAACQDERLQRYIPVPRPYRREHAVEYVETARRSMAAGRKQVMAVVDPADHARLFGVISLTIAGRCGNAAYWVTPEARGRGAARRALRLLADWAFGAPLHLAVILLEIHETNTASVAVAEAAGFHRSGSVEVPADGLADGPGGTRTAELYSRLASDVVP
jgi:RimJ/RimL family protein N-acetyltransferase